MATKTSSKKTAAKPAATKPVVPVVVTDVKKVGIGLGAITVPESLIASRDKLAASINRYADRVGKMLAGAGKKAEKEAAKKVRADSKTKRDADRRTKKVAARDALRAKLAIMDAELKS